MLNQSVILGSTAPIGLKIRVNTNGLDGRKITSAIIKTIRPDGVTVDWFPSRMFTSIDDVKIQYLYQIGDLIVKGRHRISVIFSGDGIINMPTTLANLFVI